MSEHDTTADGEGSLGYGYGPTAGGAPTALCVLLHGFGADGADMLPAAALLGSAYPGMFFAAPNAPELCITDPTCFQWYDPLAPRELADLYVRELAPRINRYIDSQLERLGIDDTALVLLGFSQGGAIAIEAALRRPKACAALLCFTGAVRDKTTLGERIASRPPTLLVHGADDEVVPLHTLQRSAAWLNAAGVPTRTHVCADIGHTMNEDGVFAAVHFLHELGFAH